MLARVVETNEASAMLVESISYSRTEELRTSLISMQINANLSLLVQVKLHSHFYSVFNRIYVMWWCSSN